MTNKTMKRVDMKKMVKPMFAKTLISLMNGQYCKSKVMKLKIQTYVNGGFIGTLDNYSCGVTFNIYQNGEITYNYHNALEYSEKITIVKSNTMYDEIEVRNKVQDAIDHVKEECRLAFRGY